jgi:DNA-binding transcriptional MocR family regulator
VTRDAPPTHTPPAAGTLVVEEARFAIVPEWVIDTAISDGAFRLYSLLLRYGNGSGSRMPSRQTLARRLRRSVDAIDRAMRQLTEAGIVRVEHRRNGEQFLSNRYHVRTTAPAELAAADGGSRTSAATPAPRTTGSRRNAATPGRTSAARVAAKVRHNPEILTDKPPPPNPSHRSRSAPTPVEEADHDLLEACNITELDQLVARCMTARQVLGNQPPGGRPGAWASSSSWPW